MNEFSENSNSTFDLYSDLIAEDVTHKENTYGQVCQSLEEARKTIALLQSEVDKFRKVSEENAQKNVALEKNISTLYKTAQSEIHRKDAEIQQLRKGIKTFPRREAMLPPRGPRCSSSDSMLSPVSRSNGELSTSMESSFEPAMHSSPAHRTDKSRTGGNGVSNSPQSSSSKRSLISEGSCNDQDSTIVASPDYKSQTAKSQSEFLSPVPHRGTRDKDRETGRSPGPSRSGRSDRYSRTSHTSSRYSCQRSDDRWSPGSSQRSDDRRRSPGPSRYSRDRYSDRHDDRYRRDRDKRLDRRKRRPSDEDQRPPKRSRYEYEKEQKRDYAKKLVEKSKREIRRIRETPARSVSRCSSVVRLNVCKLEADKQKSKGRKSKEITNKETEKRAKSNDDRDRHSPGKDQDEWYKDGYRSERNPKSRSKSKSTDREAEYYSPVKDRLDCGRGLQSGDERISCENDSRNIDSNRKASDKHIRKSTSSSNKVSKDSSSCLTKNTPQEASREISRNSPAKQMGEITDLREKLKRKKQNLMSSKQSLEEAPKESTQTQMMEKSFETSTETKDLKNKLRILQKDIIEVNKENEKFLEEVKIINKETELSILEESVTEQCSKEKANSEDKKSQNKNVNEDENQNAPTSETDGCESGRNIQREEVLKEGSVQLKTVTAFRKDIEKSPIELLKTETLAESFMKEIRNKRQIKNKEEEKMDSKVEKEEKSELESNEKSIRDNLKTKDKEAHDKESSVQVLEDIEKQGKVVDNDSCADKELPKRYQKVVVFTQDSNSIDSHSVGLKETLSEVDLAKALKEQNTGLSQNEQQPCAEKRTCVSQSDQQSSKELTEGGGSVTEVLRMSTDVESDVVDSRGQVTEESTEKTMVEQVEVSGSQKMESKDNTLDRKNLGKRDLADKKQEKTRRRSVEVHLDFDKLKGFKSFAVSGKERIHETQGNICQGNKNTKGRKEQDVPYRMELMTEESQVYHVDRNTVGSEVLKNKSQRSTPVLSKNSMQEEEDRQSQVQKKDALVAFGIHCVEFSKNEAEEKDVTYLEKRTVMTHNTASSEKTSLKMKKVNTSDSIDKNNSSNDVPEKLKLAVQGQKNDEYNSAVPNDSTCTFEQSVQGVADPEGKKGVLKGDTSTEMTDVGKSEEKEIGDMNGQSKVVKISNKKDKHPKDKKRDKTDSKKKKKRKDRDLKVAESISYFLSKPMSPSQWKRLYGDTEHQGKSIGDLDKNDEVVRNNSPSREHPLNDGGEHSEVEEVVRKDSALVKNPTNKDEAEKNMNELFENGHGSGEQTLADVRNTDQILETKSMSESLKNMSNTQEKSETNLDVVIGQSQTDAVEDGAVLNGSNVMELSLEGEDHELTPQYSKPTEQLHDDSSRKAKRKSFQDMGVNTENFPPLHNDASSVGCEQSVNSVLADKKQAEGNYDLTSKYSAGEDGNDSRSKYENGNFTSLSDSFAVEYEVESTEEELNTSGETVYEPDIPGVVSSGIPGVGPYWSGSPLLKRRRKKPVDKGQKVSKKTQGKSEHVGIRKELEKTVAEKDLKNKKIPDMYTSLEKDVQSHEKTCKESSGTAGRKNSTTSKKKGVKEIVKDGKSCIDGKNKVSSVVPLEKEASKKSEQKKTGQENCSSRGSTSSKSNKKKVKNKGVEKKSNTRAVMEEKSSMGVLSPASMEKDVGREGKEISGVCEQIKTGASEKQQQKSKEFKSKEFVEDSDSDLDQIVKAISGVASSSEIHRLEVSENIEGGKDNKKKLKDKKKSIIEISSIDQERGRKSSEFVQSKRSMSPMEIEKNEEKSHQKSIYGKGVIKMSSSESENKQNEKDMVEKESKRAVVDKEKEKESTVTVNVESGLKTEKKLKLVVNSEEDHSSVPEVLPDSTSVHVDLNGDILSPEKAKKNLIFSPSKGFKVCQEKQTGLVGSTELKKEAIQLRKNDMEVPTATLMNTGNSMDVHMLNLNNGIGSDILTENSVVNDVRKSCQLDFDSPVLSFSDACLSQKSSTPRNMSNGDNAVDVKENHVGSLEGQQKVEPVGSRLESPSKLGSPIKDKTGVSVSRKVSPGGSFSSANRSQSSLNQSKSSANRSSSLLCLIDEINREITYFSEKKNSPLLDTAKQEEAKNKLIPESMIVNTSSDVVGHETFFQEQNSFDSLSTSQMKVTSTTGLVAPCNETNASEGFQIKETSSLGKNGAARKDGQSCREIVKDFDGIDVVSDEFKVHVPSGNQRSAGNNAVLTGPSSIISEHNITVFEGFLVSVDSSRESFDVLRPESQQRPNLPRQVDYIVQDESIPFLSNLNSQNSATSTVKLQNSAISNQSTTVMVQTAEKCLENIRHESGNDSEESDSFLTQNRNVISEARSPVKLSTENHLQQRSPTKLIQYQERAANCYSLECSARVFPDAKDSKAKVPLKIPMIRRVSPRKSKSKELISRIEEEMSTQGKVRASSSDVAEHVNISPKRSPRLNVRKSPVFREGLRSSPRLKAKSPLLSKNVKGSPFSNTSRSNSNQSSKRVRRTLLDKEEPSSDDVDEVVEAPEDLPADVDSSELPDIPDAETIVFHTIPSQTLGATSTEYQLDMDVDIQVDKSTEYRKDSMTKVDSSKEDISYAHEGPKSEPCKKKNHGISSKVRKSKVPVMPTRKSPRNCVQEKSVRRLTSTGSKQTNSRSPEGAVSKSTDVNEKRRSPAKLTTKTVANTESPCRTHKGTPNMKKGKDNKLQCVQNSSNESSVIQSPVNQKVKSPIAVDSSESDVSPIKRTGRKSLSPHQGSSFNSGKDMSTSLSHCELSPRAHQGFFSTSTDTLDSDPGMRSVVSKTSPVFTEQAKLEARKCMSHLECSLPCSSSSSCDSIIEKKSEDSKEDTSTADENVPTSSCESVVETNVKVAKKLAMTLKEHFAKSDPQFSSDMNSVSSSDNTSDDESYRPDDANNESDTSDDSYTSDTSDSGESVQSVVEKCSTGRARQLSFSGEEDATYKTGVEQESVNSDLSRKSAIEAVPETQESEGDLSKSSSDVEKTEPFLQTGLTFPKRKEKETEGTANHCSMLRHQSSSPSVKAMSCDHSSVKVKTANAFSVSQDSNQNELKDSSKSSGQKTDVIEDGTSDSSTSDESYESSKNDGTDYNQGNDLKVGERAEQDGLCSKTDGATLRQSERICEEKSNTSDLSSGEITDSDKDANVSIHQRDDHEVSDENMESSKTTDMGPPSLVLGNNSAFKKTYKGENSSSLFSSFSEKDDQSAVKDMSSLRDSVFASSSSSSRTSLFADELSLHAGDDNFLNDELSFDIPGEDIFGGMKNGQRRSSRTTTPKKQFSAAVSPMKSMKSLTQTKTASPWHGKLSPSRRIGSAKRKLTPTKELSSPTPKRRHLSSESEETSADSATITHTKAKVKTPKKLKSRSKLPDKDENIHVSKPTNIKSQSSALNPTSVEAIRSIIDIEPLPLKRIPKLSDSISKKQSKKSPISKEDIKISSESDAKKKMTTSPPFGAETVLRRSPRKGSCASLVLASRKRESLKNSPRKDRLTSKDLTDNLSPSREPCDGRPFSPVRNCNLTPTKRSKRGKRRGSGKKQFGSPFMGGIRGNVTRDGHDSPGNGSSLKGRGRRNGRRDSHDSPRNRCKRYDDVARRYDSSPIHGPRRHSDARSPHRFGPRHRRCRTPPWYYDRDRDRTDDPYRSRRDRSHSRSPNKRDGLSRRDRPRSRSRDRSNSRERISSRSRGSKMDPRDSKYGNDRNRSKDKDSRYPDHKSQYRSRDMFDSVNERGRTYRGREKQDISDEIRVRERLHIKTPERRRSHSETSETERNLSRSKSRDSRKGSTSGSRSETNRNRTSKGRRSGSAEDSDLWPASKDIHIQKEGTLCDSIEDIFVPSDSEKAPVQCNWNYDLVLLSNTPRGTQYPYKRNSNQKTWSNSGTNGRQERSRRQSQDYGDLEADYYGLSDEQLLTPNTERFDVASSSLKSGKESCSKIRNSEDEQADNGESNCQHGQGMMELAAESGSEKSGTVGAEDENGMEIDGSVSGSASGSDEDSDNLEEDKDMEELVSDGYNDEDDSEDSRCSEAGQKEGEESSDNENTLEDGEINSSDEDTVEGYSGSGVESETLFTKTFPDQSSKSEGIASHGIHSNHAGRIVGDANKNSSYKGHSLSALDDKGIAYSSRLSKEKPDQRNSDFVCDTKRRARSKSGDIETRTSHCNKVEIEKKRTNNEQQQRSEISEKENMVHRKKAKPVHHTHSSDKVNPGTLGKESKTVTKLGTDTSIQHVQKSQTKKAKASKPMDLRSKLRRKLAR